MSTTEGSPRIAAESAVGVPADLPADEVDTVELPQAPARPLPPPADVLLADGTIARVRVATADDTEALAQLHAGMSPDNLRMRFFSPSRRAAEEYVEHLRRDEGPLALLVERQGRVVALATAEPIEPEVAEIAFVVDDTLHGVGLGSLLLEHLAAAARALGMRRFVAEVLGENRAMIDVFLDAGFAVRRQADSGTIHVEMDTVASAEAVAAADERECRAETRSLQPLLYPRSVAVAGIRRDGTGVGAAVLRSIVAGGYRGDLWAVHPQATELDGVPVTRRLADLSEPVDLVVVAVPARRVVATLRDAAEAGVPAAVVISAGFEELGEEGARLQREIVDLARSRSIRLVGPGCLGLMANHPDISLNATFSGAVPPPGGLAVASQSGGVGIVLADVARELGLGVGSFVSLGSKVDVSSNDLLAAWRDDPRVTAAALYLESFGNAAKFARFARRFAELKPLLAVVGGRTDVGRRAGAPRAVGAAPAVGVEALFAQAGVISCHGAEDLAETALLLEQQPLPGGLRLGVLSNAGGLGVLAADAAEEHGLVVPELSDRLRARLSRHVRGTTGTGNPVDAGAGCDPRAMAALADELLRSGEVDALVVVLVATGVSDSVAAMRRIAKVRRVHQAIPVVLVPMGGLTPPTRGLAGTTTLRTPDVAVRALARAARYAAWQRQARQAPDPVDPGRGERARAVADRLLLATVESGSRGWLGIEEVRELVGEYDLAPVGEVAHDAIAAAGVATELGYPVAVKAASRDVLHRTDRGLVRVGLGSPVEVAAAVREFERELGRPGGPVLVQPVARGVEIALRVVRDPGFGPLVVVAAGGVATDLWGDRVFLLPPVSRGDAARAVRSLRVWPLLDGFRGSPPADVASLQRLLVQLGSLAEDVPQVAELHANPVLVGPEGAVLVDVKVRLTAGRPVDAGIPRRLRGR